MQEGVSRRTAHPLTPSQREGGKAGAWRPRHPAQGLDTEKKIRLTGGTIQGKALTMMMGFPPNCRLLIPSQREGGKGRGLAAPAPRPRP